MTLIAWIVGTVAASVVIGLLWLIYYSSVYEKELSGWRFRCLEFAPPLLVGAVVYLVTEHLVVTLFLAGPLLFFGLLGMINLAEKIKTLSRHRVRHVEASAISIIILLVVAFAAVASKTPPQRTANLISLFAGAGIGTCAGVLMMVGALLSGSRLGGWLAVIAGILGWAVPGFGVTQWFERVANQAWSGGFTNNPRGLYVTGLILSSIVAATLVTITLKRMRPRG